MAELPPSWAWRTVAEIGEVGLGRQRSPNNHVGPHMRSYVRAANITWNGWNLSDVKKMNFNPADFQHFRLRVGDLLLNEGSGSAKEVGKPAIWRGEIEDCCFQNTLIRVQPTECSSEYLYFFFLWLARSGGLAPETQGVNIHHIGRAGIANCRLPVPPLAEQRRIVARIEALFARIRRARADLERIAALSCHYRRLILAREYEGAHGASAEQHSFVMLGDCVNDFTYGTAAKSSREIGGSPILRIPNVAAGCLSFDDMKFAVLPERERQKLSLRLGDILIVRSNGSPELVGRSAMVEQPAVGMAFAGYLIRARARQERVEPAYLLHMLASPSVRGTIELNARSSSGVHNINAAELASLKVPLPSLDEQRLAIRRIECSNAHALIWEADAAHALALLDRLEQSILTRAFRGELLPQQASNASAEGAAEDVCLPRIPSTPRQTGRAAA